MKKAAVVLMLLVLTGWAIYDTFLQKNNFEKKTEGMDSSQAVEGIEVGNRAPDFALRTLDGKEGRLSDFRGKKVIVNIWATWCPPCRAEMPDMQTFYEEYKNQGVEIVAVNLTKSEKNLEQVARFIEAYGITFTVVLDEQGEVSQRYQAQAIPTSYVIDSAGIIRNKMIGPMSKDWMVEQMKQID